MILALLIALATGPCLEGDIEAGSNCIHEESRPLRDPWSTVYRSSGETVWSGVGKVIASDPAFLIVQIDVGFTLTMRCPWETVSYRCPT